MTRTELARQIYHAAHLTGTFRLRSGVISSYYFDKYQFESDPILLRAIARELAPQVPTGTEIIAGPEMGAIPLATALSFETGLPAVFVRKTPKEYGTRRQVEGIDVADRTVLLIEDVVTSGGQLIESAQVLRDLGAIVHTTLVVILRAGNARELLGASGLTLKPLFLMDEIEQAATDKPGVSPDTI
ncbi:MAG: phosphoribosyltransferase family protein [Dehalococcoidia bacterium]